ncbi:efflux RND transporter periplasmic adaptor subunit [Hymenobacter sp. BT770]|uniref:efflux RND transporter periplasmic adaptor subunit n=1 Tax=Hymenobacter sp. BT770 TaxID=2886942 RepID=UPI001D0F54E3|nr:efflux RND transporter periplasmic adaptor subunit [Hymenobacter sp. BT770]MCC3153564.1 efflux RND transporter periplasmic adaptor subunit [Hymenobacter sp. BT770]MDO3415800.1 efflux RND transporter periplasmic adaptor subunit [Hymenobacter sp. BT770]
MSAPAFHSQLVKTPPAAAPDTPTPLVAPNEGTSTVEEQPKQPGRTRLWLWLALIVAVGAGVYFWLRPRPTTWKWYTTPVAVAPLEKTVTATGPVTAVRTVAVGTQVSGVISAIYVDYNSPVRKGQVIAELDKTSLRAALNDATANLQKATVQARQSQRDFARSRALYAKSYIARSEFETARNTYLTALANQRSAQTQRDRARINLGYATITAPISGVVVNRQVDVGQTVAASFNTPTLFTIANDLTRMQVEAAVDEADIGQVKIGQPVRFTVDAYPGRTFRGVVRQVRLQPSIIQSVVTYTVIIGVANPDRALLPGMTANLTIATARHPAAPTVPAGALSFTPPTEYLSKTAQPAPAGKARQRGEATVWVQEGTALRPVHVRVGASDGLRTQVEGPLRAGQLVATGQDLGTPKPRSGSLVPAFPGGPGGPGGRRGPGM